MPDSEIPRFDVIDDENDVDDGVQLMVDRVPLLAAPPELVAFVDGTLQDFLTGAGKVNKRKWCTQWAAHPDAVHRLAAIYDEWVIMLKGGKGAPSLHMFIREVIDYHLPMLTSPEDGVFNECDVDGHQPHKRLDDAAQKAAEASTRALPAWGGDN